MWWATKLNWVDRRMSADGCCDCWLLLLSFVSSVVLLLCCFAGLRLGCLTQHLSMLWPGLWQWEHDADVLLDVGREGLAECEKRQEDPRLQIPRMWSLHGAA